MVAEAGGEGGGSIQRERGGKKGIVGIENIKRERTTHQNR